MTDPSSFHLHRVEQFTAKAESMRGRYDRLSFVRLMVFIAGIALVVFCFSLGFFTGLLTAAVFFTLFVYGVKLHQRLDAKATHAEHLAGIAAAELAALEHDFSTWPDGSRFADAQHPYAADLDIVGPHSLFQFLNRCVTAGGEERLADYLKRAAPPGLIVQRQQAIAALGVDQEWSHEFRGRGTALQDDPSHRRQLLQWLDLPPMVESSPGLKAARWFVPLLFVLTVYGFFVLPVWQLALIGWVPVVLIMRRHGEAIAHQHAFTAKVSATLQYYAELLTWMEEKSWSSSLLTDLSTPLHRGDGAAKALRELQYATAQLDVRYNSFSVLLELSGLWSIQWIYRLEKWRATYHDDLPKWFDSLAEMDALVSLGNLRFNQPRWSFATVDEKRCFYGVSLAHPLLHPNGRVSNTLEMSTDGHIHLVTGSNMAGKSTWLRTVGINIVLALAGAPVCAESLTLPPLQVWTSMRTQDALHESTSSFFAELKRLKAIIEAVESPDQEVFFLLDEILKGTNSRDRHTGARALIRQLVQARGAGIIATHDLELAEMENEAGSQVENYAMEVQIEAGKLVFDYKLHRGVSKSFNATVLMFEMGIRIAEEDIQVFRE